MHSLMDDASLEGTRRARAALPCKRAYIRFSCDFILIEVEAGAVFHFTAQGFCLPTLILQAGEP